MAKSRIDSAAAVRRAWADLLRRVAPRQGCVHLLLWLWLIGVAAAVGWQALSLLRDHWQRHGAGWGSSIALPPPPAPVPVPEPPAAPPAPAAAAAAPAELPPAPEFDWRQQARLRRAAALLAAHDDLEGALLLLLGDEKGGGYDDAKRTAEASFAEVRRQLGSLAAEEIGALASYWRGVTPEQRAKLYPPEPGALLARVDAALAQPPGLTVLPELDKCLPPSLLFLLQNRLRARLQERAPAPPLVYQLVLDGAFPGDNALRRVLAQAPPASGPWDEHRQAFREALGSQVLEPLLRRLLAGEQERLKKLEAAELAWWREEIYRPAPADALLGSDPAALGRGDLELLWRRLPEWLRGAWGRRLLGQAAASLEVPPATAAVWLEGSPWLALLDEQLGRDRALELLRRHPAWRAQLRQFDYTGALALLPRVLEELQAREYQEFVRGRLLESLGRESAEFGRSDFPWLALGRRLGVGEERPAGLRGAAAKPGRVLGLTWGQVPESAFRQALDELAARHTPPLRDRYRLLLQMYGDNRGLERPAAKP